MEVVPFRETVSSRQQPASHLHSRRCTPLQDWWISPHTSGAQYHPRTPVAHLYMMNAT